MKLFADRRWMSGYEVTSHRDPDIESIGFVQTEDRRRIIPPSLSLSLSEKL